ncbi:putative ion transport protein-like, partial [Homarus americanus]
GQRWAGHACGSSSWLDWSVLKDCFDNEWFPKCVTYIEHDHLLEEYKKMKEYLNLRDL